MMTRLETQTRIKALREELEWRHKTGMTKMADDSGVPVPTAQLQDELFKLIYKLSKME